MPVLLTGAAGFIGSNLCERLLLQGHQIVGIDNFNSFYSPKIKEKNTKKSLKHRNFSLVKGDILDRELLNKIFADYEFKKVIHLAAWAGVRPSIENPSVYQKTNLEGTVNLLECCRNSGVEKFIFASSSSVYGNQEKVPFSESDPANEPISPYAATKRAGELLCYTWHKLFGLDISCLRFFTVYGPRQRPEMAIHKFCRALSRGERIRLFGDGLSSRDYSYIEDITAGIEAALERCQGYRIYNLGGSKTTSLLELVQLLSRALNCTPEVEHLPHQPGDVQRTYADIRRAQEELGYAPQVNIEEGIRRFVEWFRALDG